MASSRRNDADRVFSERHGLDRRDFIRVCTMAAVAVGLPASVGVKWAEAAAKGLKPSVIWLHFQECTGCTESLLRTSHPALAQLILDLVSLDYCETLFAAAGYQAEDALKSAMAANAGKYICVVEGAIPTKDNGIYCKIGGKTAIDMVNEVADKAGAIIAIGSCASWGGIPSADPNPTGAVGAPQILAGKTVVTIPGCPANPYNFLGTALQFVTFGTLPALDDKGRPMWAYARVIHEDCPRRPHFDAGRFAQQFGDEGHRQGLVPVQDRLQGSGDPRQLLAHRSARSAPGRSASATPASDAPSRRSRSGRRSTTTVEDRVRRRPTLIRRFKAPQGGRARSQRASPVSSAARWWRRMGGGQEGGRRRREGVFQAGQGGVTWRSIDAPSSSRLPWVGRRRRRCLSPPPRGKLPSRPKRWGCSTTPRCASAARRVSSRVRRRTTCPPTAP